MTGALNTADIRGNLHAAPVLAAAARTRAGVLLIGPPGCGKTMIAARMPGLLPPPTPRDRWRIAATLARARLWDGDTDPAEFGRPFRAPHHTVSVAGMVGAAGRPGEVDLAGLGVLFLDELPEFPPATIAALRNSLTAMDDHRRPWVVGAANPCACGNYGSTRRACACTAAQVDSYRARTRKVATALGLRVDLALEPAVDGAAAWPASCELRWLAEVRP